MNFIAFRRSFIDIGCMNTDQIEALYPTFERVDLARWVKQGLLTKLRHRQYTFPELVVIPEMHLYISNRIYEPSYVSLYSALAFHGMIPAAVPQITAISTRKGIVVDNEFGTYQYKRVAEKLFFGYESKPFDQRTLLVAEPEKALLDLFYFYSIYNSATEIKKLGLDKKFLTHTLNIKRLDAYAARFESTPVARRVALFKKVYNLKAKR